MNSLIHRLSHLMCSVSPRLCLSQFMQPCKTISQDSIIRLYYFFQCSLFDNNKNSFFFSFFFVRFSHCSMFFFNDSCCSHQFGTAQHNVFTQFTMQSILQTVTIFKHLLICWEQLLPDTHIALLPHTVVQSSFDSLFIPLIFWRQTLRFVLLCIFCVFLFIWWYSL